MNLDFFLTFSKFRIASLVSAEDFADKLNYQVTSALMLMFLVVVGVRQYIFAPIQCWVPKEFGSAWEQYAENYCWVADTYFSRVGPGPPAEIRQREKRQIGYYQWVPFVLGLQALLFYFPHIVWKMLSVRSGTNIRSVVRYAAEANSFDQGERSKQIGFLARQLEKIIVAKRRHPPSYTLIEEETRWQRFRRSCCVSVFSRRSGMALLSIYFIIKMLYLVNSLAQLYMMRMFLGFNSTTFGVDILVGLVDGRTWQHSGLFPRVTWCDFVIRRVGNPQRYSVQCVLPINMLNEKIYIFLWLWIAVCALLMLLSITRWTVSMLCVRYRRRFVKYYLRLMGPLSKRKAEEDEPRLINKFVNNFLRHDGVLILRMICHNAGDLVVAELLNELWVLWREKHFPGLTNGERQDRRAVEHPPRRGGALPPLPAARSAPPAFVPNAIKRRNGRSNSGSEDQGETEPMAV